MDAVADGHGGIAVQAQPDLLTHWRQVDRPDAGNQDGSGQHQSDGGESNGPVGMDRGSVLAAVRRMGALAGARGEAGRDPSWPCGLARATLHAIVLRSRKSSLPFILASAACLLGMPSFAADDAEGGRREAEVSGVVYSVAALGDSLTDTRAGGGLYLRMLAQRCPRSRFDAHGVGGQRTDHMKWRLGRDIWGDGDRRATKRPAYSHLIVLGGVNDLVASPRGYANTDSIRRNLLTIWRQARGRGLIVIALTVPPWTSPGPVRDLRIAATDRLNEWMLRQAQEGNVDRVVNIHDRLVAADGVSLDPAYRRFRTDFVHWNERGHQVVADTLYGEVFADCR